MHPDGGTWCGKGDIPSPEAAEIRPRIPVCACCHIKAMHTSVSAAWEAGKIAGFKQADWEYGASPVYYTATNPYEEKSV